VRHNLSLSPKLIILSVFSVLILLTVLRLHGFSDGAWDGILGPSLETPARIISGEPQPIRSDDWAVNLTFMKSQLKHEPKFPVINTLIGDGQNMIVVNNAPVLHWTSLFKPSSWGWFISEDIGMSWFWWMRAFLIFTGFFLLFRELAQNTMMGLCAAVFMVFNPLFVHWSYIFCEIAAFGSLATYFAIQIFKSDDYKKIFFWMLPLGYVATAAVFQLYPAYLIPAIWAFLFVFISWCVSDLKRLRAASLKINLVRFFAISSGICLTLLCTYGLIDSLGDAYTLITNAAYPGARNEKGGDGRLISLFINYLSLTRIRDLTQYVGNICEGSNFLCLLQNFFGRRRH